MRRRPEAGSAAAKMLAGELYDPLDPELQRARNRAREFLGEFNRSPPDRADLRAEILGRLLGGLGAGVLVEPPFYCDYGTNIVLGSRVFINFNCVILDPASVRIGDDVLLGPAVQVYTASHPLNAEERRKGREFARPVEIGSDVWIGGGVVICPGVTVGSRSAIAAGSVVTRSVPDGVLAAGNPCRVIRALHD